MTIHDAATSAMWLPPIEERHDTVRYHTRLALNARMNIARIDADIHGMSWGILNTVDDVLMTASKAAIEDYATPP